MNDVYRRVNNWVRRTEDIFNFAKTARDIFENGTLDEKRGILSALGSNLTLKDRKLSISVHEPLMLIEDISDDVKKISERLEPLQDPENKRTLGEICSQSPMMLRWIDQVRTCFMEQAA